MPTHAFSQDTVLEPTVRGWRRFKLRRWSVDLNDGGSGPLVHVTMRFRRSRGRVGFLDIEL